MKDLGAIRIANIWLSAQQNVFLKNGALGLN
jgi:hypothetical protein